MPNCQVLMGLVLQMQQAKRLTQEEYAMNHPAGRIGKRLILRVHDIMLTGPALPLAAPDTLIMEARIDLALFPSFQAKTPLLWCDCPLF